MTRSEAAQAIREDETVTALEALAFLTESLDTALETLHADVKFIRDKILDAFHTEQGWKSD